MKNLYLYIIVFISITSAFGQDLQNANWYFGNYGSGLHFNTTNPTLTPSISTLPNPINSNGNFFHNVNGHTTVSDVNGNLLFFSDGRSLFQLWGGTYHSIASFLPESDTYSNRTVTVPKPGDSSNYFVVMSKDYLETAALSGLQYSEIDLSNGLAQMLSLNVSLKDSNNSVIDGNYNLNACALGSALHSDGENYWVIAHVRKQGYSKILSYKVTSAGIDAAPSASFTMPDVFGSNIIVSKDSKKIAVATSNGVYLGNFNNSNGSITMTIVPSTENSSYQDVAFSPNSQNLYYSKGNNLGGSSSGIKVIDTGNFIITSVTNVPIMGMQLGIDGKIYTTDTLTVSVINNPNDMLDPRYVEDLNSLIYLPEGDFPQWVHRNTGCSEGMVTGIVKAGELGGIISGCYFTWDNIAPSYVIEVVSDSDCINPLVTPKPIVPYFEPFYATITVYGNLVTVQSLRDLVGQNQFKWRIKTSCGIWSDWCCYDMSLYPGFSPNCISIIYPFVYQNQTCFHGERSCNIDIDLIITETVLSGDVVEEQATNTVTAINTISNGANVDYHAGNAVFLNPGFITQTGSVFLGHIEECTDEEARPSQARSDAETNIAESPKSLVDNEVKKENIIISPNPSSSFVEISLENFRMKSIAITSMDGRVMFDRNVSDIASYELDISNYNVGIYMITVRTATGKVVTGKIIKN